MHRPMSKKIFVYLFFFIILSTSNNISLNNSNVSKIKKINVSGLSQKENLKILNEINLLNLDNIFFVVKSDITDIIEKNSLVETFYVKKKYPSELNIEIKKTNFLANLKSKDKLFYIGSNGKLIFSKFKNENLPNVYGNPTAKDFIKFKTIIESSKFDFNEISEVYFFRSKRWDIKTKKELLIKLPDKDIKEAFNLSYVIMNDINFFNVKLIDLRIKNQIITNEQ